MLLFMSIKHADYESKRQEKFTECLWTRGHYTFTECLWTRGHYTLHITHSLVWPLKGCNQMVDVGWYIIFSALLFERNIMQKNSRLHENNNVAMFY